MITINNKQGARWLHPNQVISITIKQMLIEIEEYEQRRSLSDFVSWLDAYRASLIASPDRVHESIVRSNKISRRIFEEAWPIRTYVQKHWQSRSGDTITLHAGSQPFDAVITNKNDKVVQYVEVTQAIAEKDHLMRKELAESGGYLSAVYAQVGDEVAWLSKKINLLIDKKLKKPYPEPASLVIGLYDDVLWDNEAVFNATLSQVRFDQGQRTFGAILFTSQNGKMSRMWKQPHRPD